MGDNLKVNEFVLTPMGRLALILELYTEEGIERAYLQYKNGDTVILPRRILRK